MNALSAFAVFLVVAALAVVLLRKRPAASEADRALAGAIDLAIRQEFPLHGVHIDVKSHGGMVVLGGFVREHEQRKRVVELARANGARGVDDRILIRSGG